MNSLTEIINQVSEIEKQLADSGGELTPELEAMIVQVEISLPAKIDSYDYVIRKMSHAAEFYKERAQFFTKFSKSCENVGKKIKDSLKFRMLEMGLEELLGNEIRFKLRNNKPSVFIKDESLVPDKYRIAVTTYKIDNDKILADLKAGVDVPGAEILQSKSVLVYPNNK